MTSKRSPYATLRLLPDLPENSESKRMMKHLFISLMLKNSSMRFSNCVVLMNLKQENLWTQNTSISLLMEQNSKLILILMVKKYANVNLKEFLIVNARDSTMLMKLLGVMTLTEIAMSMVITFTKSTHGVLTTKLNYLPI